MEPNTVDEFDLALVNALQLRPRAEWTELGSALGVTPATVARRWQALTDAGLAWLAVTAGSNDGSIGSALVLVSCHAGDAADLGRRLARESAVSTIAETMGRWRFLLDVPLPDIDALRTYLSSGLSAVEGVREVMSLLVTGSYTAGNQWRVRALDADQLRLLDDKPKGGRRRGHGVDDLDRALIQALAEDARQSWAVLGARCGVTAPTARRRVERLLDANVIGLRSEISQAAMGQAVHVTFLMRVPATQLDAVGRMFAQTQKCRVAVPVAGPHNLVTTMWFSTVTELAPFEKALAQRFPDLVVDDRIVHLRTTKRVGHLVDDRQRRVALVPLAAW